MYARLAPWRRPSRRDQAVSAIRDGASTRSLVVVGAVVAGVAVLAVVGRRWLWQAVGLAARAVEEAADTVEDAAEDLGERAAQRTGGDSD
jgi:hypothetical protein